MSLRFSSTPRYNIVYVYLSRIRTRKQSKLKCEKVTKIISGLFLKKKKTHTYVSLDHPGAHVAQWVKRWPTGLVLSSSSPARGEIF